MERPRAVADGVDDLDAVPVELVVQGLQCRDDILRARDTGGILLRSDQDEVVVHHRIALHAEALGEEGFLGGPGMDEHDVGIAAPRRVERLAGALGHHLHLDAGPGLE